jgi:hypothetical protein
MNISYLPRARESDMHQTMKHDAAVAFGKCDYKVFFETNLSDVVAVRIDDGFVLAIEAETGRNRNCVHNCIRDLSRGANAVLVVCKNLQAAAACSRLLSRTLPKELREKTALTTINTLQLMKPTNERSEPNE